MKLPLWMRHVFGDLFVYDEVKASAPLPKPELHPDMHPDMHPIVPPAPVEDLTVSCLVLGIVKSIEAGEQWTWGNGYAGRGERTHESGMKVAYPEHSLMSSNGDWHHDLPHHTSSGHVFNAKEARLIEDTFDARLKKDQARWAAENAQRIAEASKRFIALGCPLPALKADYNPLENGAEHYVIAPPTPPRKRRKRST